MDVWNADAASAIYKNLQGDLAFRLLVIHPGQRGDPLKTELLPTTLDEAQAAYDATSYTWGAPVNPERINCGDSHLWVQRNAFDMMVDLRRPDRPRRVWIDAICINQCNLDERAAQVSIMHQIYRRAGATWVWIGRPDEHSSATMAYAASLDAKKFVDEFSYCQYGTNWYRFAEKSYFFDPSFNKDIDAGRLQDLAVGIVDFLNRQWFSRVWIQQEASLSSDVKVVCGPDAVDWDNIFALAWIMCPRYTETWPDYVHERLSATINNIQAVRIIQRSRHYYFQERYGPSDVALGFEGLIEYVSRYQATDARDRVYAMGNIIADGHHWFEVDYRVPWQILYTDVARRFLEADALRFLQNAGKVRQEPDTGLPSWAPDYRYREESDFMIARATSWKAGGNSHPALVRSSTSASSSKVVSLLPKGRKRQFPMTEELKAYRGVNKSLLQSFASFKGLMSDEITYVGDVVDTDKGDLETNIKAIFATIRKDIDYVKTLETPDYIHGDSLLDAYKLTLIMSCNAQQETVRSEYVKEHWEDFFKWYEQGCPGYWDSNSKTAEMNAAFESSGATKTFRFAITRYGYFCLVPRIAQVGDEIAIFQSYELALVLRRLPDPPAPSQKEGTSSKKKQQQQQQSANNKVDPYFELLGDAYVHGMMENEARCISDEFNCRYEPTQAQWDKILRLSDGGRGEAWTTLDLDGRYERILRTLGPRTVRLV